MSNSRGIKFLFLFKKTPPPHISRNQTDNFLGLNGLFFTMTTVRNHSFSTYAKISEKLLFLTP